MFMSPLYTDIHAGMNEERHTDIQTDKQQTDRQQNIRNL